MNKFKEHDISGKSSKHLVETFLLKQANGGIDLQCQRGMPSLYVCVCVQKIRSGGGFKRCADIRETFACWKHLEQNALS